MNETLVQRLRREIPRRGDIGLQQTAAARIERLTALLDAARICLKNRDRSEREASVYDAIRIALADEER
jgi:hypothetical protein